jgi:type I restriction enzyme S subunit
MRSNNKRLGDFIHQVNLRNDDGSITDLRGLSLKKEFRKSTSNIIGADMTKYKVMNKWQFSANFMGLGVLVNKAAIVLKRDEIPNIVSSAYPVFEVKDKSKLNPEYLMMWFRRSEFDRYCVFKSDKGIRGGFDWNDLCDVELPIPNIEKQKAIVKEYNVIVNRIQLSEQLNEKLEETAQAIYKYWFVDFEFPNEQGKPYKSNGGKMFSNAELDKEIPDGWLAGCLDDLSIQFSGFSFKGNQYSFDNGISVVRGENVTEKKLRWDTHKKWDLELNLRMKKCYLEASDIVIGMDGSKVGKNWSLISPFELPLLLAQRVTSVRAKNDYESFYLYLSMIVLNFEEYVSRVQTGTSIPHISGQQIKNFPLLQPKRLVLKSFSLIMEKMFNKTYLNIESSKKLLELKGLLLSRMTNIRFEKEMT